MNERIKKLAEQAMVFSHENGGWRISTHVPNDFKEKFAELIIKECAGLTLDYKNDQHYNGWLDYRDEIIKHFGVEQ